jgi:hypothetical protein
VKGRLFGGTARPAGSAGGLFLAGRSVGADAVARKQPENLRGKYASLINNFQGWKCAPVAMSKTEQTIRP